MTRYYHLGPWLWEPHFEGGGTWTPPEGTVGLLDLRSLPDQAAAVTPQGCGFFATDRPLAASDYACFGNALDATLTEEQLRRWKSMLGLPALDAANLLDALWETLTVRADPDGQRGPLPLDATVLGDLELHLGGHSLVRRVRIGPGRPEWPPLRRMLQRIYRETLGEALDGTRAPDLHRKLLTTWMRKYRLASHRELIPAGLPDETPIEPTTTITESFNKADSDILGPDLTWAEVSGDWDIVSNAAQPQGKGYALAARAESDLSSSDHYAQANVTAMGAAGADQQGGTYARFSASAHTGYFGFAFRWNSHFRLWKMVAGGATQLDDVAVTLSIPVVVKTQASGSTITVYQDGISRISLTDTAIAGNTRCGVGGGYWNGSPRPSLDDFEAGDLAAAAAGGPTLAQLMRHRKYWNGSRFIIPPPGPLTLS